MIKILIIKKKKKKKIGGNNTLLNFSKENNTILSKDFIKLDDNNLLAKDIEEIKNHIIIIINQIILKKIKTHFF